MPDTFRWGILGAGKIAKKFAAACRYEPGVTLAAVGSRSAERAQAFVAEHGAEDGTTRAHDSWEALAADPDLDAVYVATRHPEHITGARLALEHDRPVLCEKPLAVNEREARAMIDLARERNRFLMEAMWTRCLPIYEVVRGWIAEGRIGEVRMLQARFGFRTPQPPEGRALNPEYAGGALLDVGVYTIALAFDVFGRPPSGIHSTALIGETGVDEQYAAVFRYDDGGIASLVGAVRTNMAKDAEILGSKGRILLRPKFHSAERAELKAEDGEETAERPFDDGNGFLYQLREAMRCIREGRLESPRVPHADSLAIARTMDAMRADWGLVYPFES